MDTVKTGDKNEVRMISFAVIVFLVVIYLISFFVSPSPAGVGTHEKIFMPPCMLYKLTGLPCPFCGATTSFALMAKGEIFEAFKVHPFAALLFVLSIPVFVCSFFCMVTGKPVKLKHTLSLLKKYKWFIITTLIISWIYKILSVLKIF